MQDLLGYPVVEADIPGPHPGEVVLGDLSAYIVKIATLTLKPGDMLLMQLPDTASLVDIVGAENKLKAVLPAGVVCLVYRGDVEFSVVRRVEE